VSVAGGNLRHCVTDPVYRLWGRASDHGGRKRVLLIGLSGTMISCLGFGFSTTFWQALIFRMLGGALNGNVGVMRTMVSEIVREKK
jgi:MFS family permease